MTGAWRTGEWTAAGWVVPAARSRGAASRHPGPAPLNLPNRAPVGRTGGDCRRFALCRWVIASGRQRNKDRLGARFDGRVLSPTNGWPHKI